MIYSTATVPVNPEGETPLTRSQAWSGLVLKARDARQFLPPGLCTRCDVVEESVTHIVREATIAGDDLREIITFEPEKKVSFFQATGPREGAIINELFEDDAGTRKGNAFCAAALRAGAYFHPRHNMFLSCAHQPADIDLALRAADAGLAAVARMG